MLPPSMPYAPIISEGLTCDALAGTFALVTQRPPYPKGERLGSFAYLGGSRGGAEGSFRVRWSVRPEPAADANAEANSGSEPVGCCRSDGPERIQETASDGVSQAIYAFWKCGWWGNPPRGFESLSLRISLIG